MQKGKPDCAELMIGKAKRFARRAGRRGEIALIAQKRTADMRHMYAQLMCPAGHGGKGEQ